MRNYPSILLLAALISFLSFRNLPAQHSAQYKTDVEVKSVAPDFTLPNLNQKQVSLGNYKNKKPVIVLFWTTWCPYCQKALKDLSAMYPSIKKDGFELLAIDVGESELKAKKFIERNSIVFPVLLDERAETADSYGILGVPTYFIIDKEGIVRFKQNYFPKDKYKQIIAE